MTTKKSTTSVVLLCIALFVPLVIAVIYGINVDPNSVAANNLKKLNVNFGEYSFSFEDENTLNLYSSISDDAREIDETFRDFSAEKPYTVTYTEENGTPITYKLYMTKNSDDCVYVSPDGKYYMMNEAVASKLVVREEFSTLNEFKSLPSVTVKGNGEGIELSPDSYSWTYTALDSSKPHLEGTMDTANPLVKFDDSENGALTVEFDKQPDSLVLKITDEAGTVAFDDKYENLSATNRLTFNSDTYLNLEIVAQWYEIDGAEYYGEAAYTVPLLYDVAPTYRVVDVNGVPAGDFTVLRMSDFNDGERLTVVNEIGIPEKINVYDASETVKIAFIPMNCDLEQGSYSLKLITEGGHEKEMEVKVKRAIEHDEYTVIFTDEGLAAAFTEANFTEFFDLVSKVTEESVNEKLYDGKFSYPTGSSKLAKNGFAYGTKLEVISLYTKKYTHEGMQLEAAKNQSVKAANNGKVVFAGQNGLYGNLVVIDHGWGVLSYYGNLAELSVSAGDTVTKGETEIGKAGSTGFACVRGGATAKVSPMVYFAVSVDGVFIDPSSPCKYGINVG